MQIIEKLQRSRPEVVHLFDELVKAMPDGTYLTSIKQTGTKLKFEGIAQSSTRVSTLMRNISASQWLRNPELEVVETEGQHRRQPVSCWMRADQRRRRRAKLAPPSGRSAPLQEATNESAPGNARRSIRATRDAGRSRCGPGRSRCASLSWHSALIYFFVWQDRMPELQQREDQEQALRNEFRTKHAKAINLALYKQQLADIEKSFGALLRQLPSKTEVPNLLVDISQTGLAARRSRRSCSSPAQEAKKDFYAELPIKIHLTGSYHNFGAFVSGIAALPRIVTLHDIQITPIDKDQAASISCSSISPPRPIAIWMTTRLRRRKPERRKAEEAKRHGS